jgi:bacteriocin-like protein
MVAASANERKTRNQRRDSAQIEVANELTQDELDKVSGGKPNTNQFAKIDGIEGESTRDEGFIASFDW